MVCLSNKQLKLELRRLKTFLKEEKKSLERLKRIKTEKHSEPWTLSQRRKQEEGE